MPPALWWSRFLLIEARFCNYPLNNKSVNDICVIWLILYCVVISPESNHWCCYGSTCCDFVIHILPSKHCRKMYPGRVKHVGKEEIAVCSRGHCFTIWCRFTSTLMGTTFSQQYALQNNNYHRRALCYSWLSMNTPWIFRIGYQNSL